MQELRIEQNRTRERLAEAIASEAQVQKQETVEPALIEKVRQLGRTAMSNMPWLRPSKPPTARRRGEKPCPKCKRTISANKETCLACS